jgi:hypothetical protein
LIRTVHLWHTCRGWTVRLYFLAGNANTIWKGLFGQLVEFRATGMKLKDKAIHDSNPRGYSITW